MISYFHLQRAYKKVDRLNMESKRQENNDILARHDKFMKSRQIFQRSESNLNSDNELERSEDVTGGINRQQRQSTPESEFNDLSINDESIEMDQSIGNTQQQEGKFNKNCMARKFSIKTLIRSQS